MSDNIKNKNEAVKEFQNILSGKVEFDTTDISLKVSSGFAFDNFDYKFPKNEFNPDISYAAFTLNDNTDYVIGSDGRASLIYAEDGIKSIIHITELQDDSILYELAANMAGDKFVENDYKMCLDECYLRDVEKLGVDGIGLSYEKIKKIDENLDSISNGMKNIEEYRDKLDYLLYNDVNGFFEMYNFEGFEYKLNQYERPSAESGFILNNRYDSELFDDNTSYVVVDMSTGGSGFDFIIGSDGDVFLKHLYPKTDLIKIDGTHIDSPLYRYAETNCGESFTENYYVMDDDENLQRRIAELGSDSFRQYLIDNAQPEKTEIISFEKFVYLLDDNKFDALEATRDILTAGTYTGLYASPSVDCEGFTQEDFIKIIETHIATIEKLASNYEDDFCEAISIFSIDTVDLTEINFDYLEDELKDKFNPEVKAENERKFKIKP